MRCSSVVCSFGNGLHFFIYVDNFFTIFSLCYENSFANPFRDILSCYRQCCRCTASVNSGNSFNVSAARNDRIGILFARKHRNCCNCAVSKKYRVCMEHRFSHNSIFDDYDNWQQHKFFGFRFVVTKRRFCIDSNSIFALAIGNWWKTTLQPIS